MWSLYHLFGVVHGMLCWSLRCFWRNPQEKPQGRMFLLGCQSRKFCRMCSRRHWSLKMWLLSMCEARIKEISETPKCYTWNKCFFPNYFIHRWRFGFRTEGWNGVIPKKRKCSPTGASKMRVFKKTSSHDPPWDSLLRARQYGKSPSRTQVPAGGRILQILQKDWPRRIQGYWKQIHSEVPCICVLRRTLETRIDSLAPSEGSMLRAHLKEPLACNIWIKAS